MIAQSFQGRPVGLCEDRLHLPLLKIAGRGDRSSLDWDGEDFSALRDVGRFLAGHEVEEAADRSKPAVARADRALAFVLGMPEECTDLAGREVSKPDLRDLAAFSLRDEPEEQALGGAIGADRMDRRVAVLG